MKTDMIQTLRKNLFSIINNKRLLSLASFFCLVLFAPTLVSAGVLQIKSYFYSPVAQYDRLHLKPTAQLSGSCDIGTIYINADLSNRLEVCADGDWNPTSLIWSTNADDTAIYTTNDAAEVGIGTSEPDYKLKIVNDGGIIAEGTFGSGQILTTAGIGQRFIWYPRKGALRLGEITGGSTYGSDQWDESNIGNYSVAFGEDNEASGNYSSVLGGFNHRNKGDYSVIVSGNRGHITSNGDYSYLGQGLGKWTDTGNIDATHAFGGNLDVEVLGPYGTAAFGTIGSGVSYGSIGGGIVGELSGTAVAPTIISGETVETTGAYSTIHSGRFSNVTTSSTLLFGYESDILSPLSFMTSAYSGTIAQNPDSTGSVYLGGYSGHVAAQYATYINCNDCSVANSSVIVGGSNIFNVGTANFIGPGVDIPIGLGHNYNSIAGGNVNIIQGDFNVIGPGTYNSILGSYSTIAAGDYNTINGNGNFAFGKNLTINGNDSFLFGVSDSATNKIISTANNSFIIADSPEAGADPIYVGINVSVPQDRLHVDGSVRFNDQITLNQLPIGSGTAPVNIDTSAGGLIGLDLAEDFPTLVDYEVGDVMVMNQKQFESVTQSNKKYDSSIVGIVSGTPAISLEGEKMSIAPKPEETKEAGKVSIALKGRVVCKVSIEGGAIERGDLLTTSSLKGHAMKLDDLKQGNHAVVGKALQSFDGKNNDTGTILVLIMG